MTTRSCLTHRLTTGRCRPEQLTLFDAAQIQQLRRALAGLEQLADFDELLKAEMSFVHMQQMVQSFVQRCKELVPGDRLAFPGGWINTNPNRNHAIVLIFERTSEERFAVVTCNTGGGVQYHPQSSDDYPKTKAQCAMRLCDIPASRVCDEALWYMILKLMCFPAEENSAAMWYEVTLSRCSEIRLKELGAGGAASRGWQ